MCTYFVLLKLVMYDFLFKTGPKARWSWYYCCGNLEFL